MRVKKPCFVYAEKMDFKGLIQLRVTEKSDQRRMWVCTVDSTTFHELKQDQSLHVTFAGFIENLVRILQDCQAGKLEIYLLQMSPLSGRGLSENGSNSNNNSGDYQLQFVEMRAFKNLIHLCLPCNLAPLNVVLFYMSSILEAMQKKSIIQDQTNQQLQHEVNIHLRRIEQLDGENMKMRENLLENSKSLNNRHANEMQQMEENLRKTSEQRQADNERSLKTIATLQAQIEKMNIEKSSIQVEKTQEMKRNEILNDELLTIKTHASKLKDQCEKLHSEIATQRNLERKNEMHLNDARKQIVDLQEKLKKYDKAKADIVAELEAEKKISQTKRKALEMATEEISKANEIIVKQSQDLLKLKKTIDWRTEVSLQQEKAVIEKENALKLRNEEINHLQNTVDCLRGEIPLQLDSMRKFANSLEVKYAEQITALKEKLQSQEKENYPLSTSSSGRSRRK